MAGVAHGRQSRPARSKIGNLMTGNPYHPATRAYIGRREGPADGTAGRSDAGFHGPEPDPGI